jgi:hypothetical protein
MPRQRYQVRHRRRLSPCDHHNGAADGVAPVACWHLLLRAWRAARQTIGKKSRTLQGHVVAALAANGTEFQVGVNDSSVLNGIRFRQSVHATLHRLHPTHERLRHDIRNVHPILMLSLQ